MADQEAQQSVPLERIRHLPEWETPIHPPKRSFFARTTLPRQLKTNPFASLHHKGGVTPRRSSSAFAPTSDESFQAQKETAVAPGNDPILPTTHASTFATATPTPPTLRSRLSARYNALLPPNKTYLCGLTRRAIVLFVLVVVVLAFALGLGLGLGLRHRGGAANPDSLPLPSHGNKVYEGDLTYYAPGLGACGLDNVSGDYIAAVAHELFDAAGANLASGGNPNENPLCGKMIRITRDYVEENKGNVTVDVMVVDRCVGCQPTDLDLSPGVYDRLAPETIFATYPPTQHTMGLTIRRREHAYHPTTAPVDRPPPTLRNDVAALAGTPNNKTPKHNLAYN
ncbi:RlpA-like double-psi beta-barrel-protein domain-containing protein-containing protein [Lasiosphaeris hirsuta]|uniref:RlpA-like double-psi beta-barrel-protein domain-containing protein-containing protein n=1 Tax=Lasiosphaeris hirsuta TaxID=260670 RepID=A0AA39ZXN1_9PEZI|nr:RlpA-like double-psi beta-barrel-protein domain-containing protein-containing protein [Lasiosphaeris hirsuta]